MPPLSLILVSRACVARCFSRVFSPLVACFTHPLLGVQCSRGGCPHGAARVFSGPLGPYVPGFGVAIFVVAGAGRAACVRRGVN